MTTEETKIQLVEENAHIGTERVVTGRVRVQTSSQTVEEHAQVSLSGETVEVIRTPMKIEIDRVPEIRVEGNTTIIPVVEEIVVVEKRLVLVEEIRIERTATCDDVTIPVTLRRQTATIERFED